MRCTKRITSWLWTTSSPSFSASRKSKKIAKKKEVKFAQDLPRFDSRAAFAKKEVLFVFYLGTGYALGWICKKNQNRLEDDTSIKICATFKSLLARTANKKKKKLATYSIRTVIRVDHVWLGVVVTRIWNYKRSREGFSLLKVSLVCRGAKSVVDWSVVGRRNPEKRNNSIQFNSSYWRANFLSKCKLFKYSSCHKE